MSILIVKWSEGTVKALYTEGERFRFDEIEVTEGLPGDARMIGAQIVGPEGARWVQLYFESEDGDDREVIVEHTGERMPTDETGEKP